MESSLLTAKDVAKVLNVSVRSVRALVKRGTLKAAHLYPNTNKSQLRFKAEWVRDHLRDMGC